MGSPVYRIRTTVPSCHQENMVEQTLPTEMPMSPFLGVKVSHARCRAPHMLPILQNELVIGLTALQNTRPLADPFFS